MPGCFHKLKMWFHTQVVLDVRFYSFRVAIQLRKASVLGVTPLRVEISPAFFPISFLL
jgi:hypothetical protein